MKLIIWLWNPWNQYKTTRHNLWFLFLDYFQEKENFSEFKYESKFKADISHWIYNGEKTLLIKPQTFMNLSWESIQKITSFYKLETKDFIVIYDDISMDFWKVRHRENGSAGWHNGIKDIIKYFWKVFGRIKVWVWLNANYDISDWVLSKFTEEELIDLDNEIFSEIDIYLKKNT